MTNSLLDDSIIDENNHDEELFELANNAKRFLNILIDTFVIYILFIAIAVLINKLKILEFREESSTELYLIFFSLHFIYYLGLESIIGRTVAKIFTGTWVVNEDGYRASFGAILLRTLCRSIPLEALSFLISPIGLHDYLSKTRVVIPVYKKIP